jgi:hypothetical protein
MNNAYNKFIRDVSQLLVMSFQRKSLAKSQFGIPFCKMRFSFILHSEIIALGLLSLFTTCPPLPSINYITTTNSITNSMEQSPS